MLIGDETMRRGEIASLEYLYLGAEFMEEPRQSGAEQNLVVGNADAYFALDLHVLTKGSATPVRRRPSPRPEIPSST